MEKQVILILHVEQYDSRITEKFSGGTHYYPMTEQAAKHALERIDEWTKSLGNCDGARAEDRAHPASSHVYGEIVEVETIPGEFDIPF